MSDCIFCKIIDKAIPSEVVFENDEMLAFKDIRPSAPVHILLIPKKHIESLAHAESVDEALLGRMMLQVPQIAKEQGLGHGFKTQINTGIGGGQEVFHIHIHILGRPQA
jgi:histidine triad (HIT) family protein